MMERRRAKPIDVHVRAARKVKVAGRPGIALEYDDPIFEHDAPHEHHIPMAALADRAVKYDLDPDHPEFLEDVLTNLIHEIHHPESHANEGVVPRKLSKVYGVNRKSLRVAAEEHVDIDFVKRHVMELSQARNVNYATLPKHLQMNYDRIV